jgi:hypothetical protein
VELVAQPLELLPAQPLELPAQASAATAEVNRWRLAAVRLQDAERRGASADELQILDEAVIAARVAMLRATDRAGTLNDPAARRQLDRDRELLRRFPGDRAGDDGVGWFEWPLKP